MISILFKLDKEPLSVPLALALFVGLWQLVVCLGDYPAFILPSPGRVYLKAIDALRKGLLVWLSYKTALGKIEGFWIHGT